MKVVITGAGGNLGRAVTPLLAAQGRVAAAVTRQEDDPVGFVRDPRIFGDLVDAPGFAQAFATTYRSIRERGIDRALELLKSVD